MNPKNLLRNKKILVIFLLASLLMPTLALAFTYTPLEPIPGVNSNAGDFPTYIVNIYKFGIMAIGIAALIMIMLGGFMYITSAGNNAAMGKAKGIITDAIVGLILAMSAYLLLYVINPDLTQINPLPQNGSVGGVNGNGGNGNGNGNGNNNGNNNGNTNNNNGGQQDCEKIKTQVNGQCKDASPQLDGLLKCMSDKLGSGMTISSISDSQGYDRCRTNWSRPPCAHSKTSCHYGGSCSDGSHAADLVGGANSQAGQQAAKECGGKINPEGNHLHVSVGNCCTL